MEKWDVYDCDGNQTGRTKTKKDIWDSGEYHLGASVWIINCLGELLIQKRAASKRIHPNIWCNIGGSVISGETSLQGCIRETNEEIGIHLEENELVLLNRFFRGKNIYDDYVTIKDFPIENITIQPEEVSEVKWASFSEIERLFSEGQFMINDISDIEKVKQFIIMRIIERG